MNHQQQIFQSRFLRTGDELKCHPRRPKRKQFVSIKPNQNKKRTSYISGKTSTQTLNTKTVGKYVLSEINPSNCFCQAYNLDNHREYSCRVIPINKYRDVISPYYQIDLHEHINKIIDVVLAERVAYVIFEKSFGDLHSYIRSKKKLKEEETCRLFKQIANVVNHCHSSGLVLRDLKLRKFVFKDRERTQLKLETLDDAHIMINNSDILYDKHGCPAYVSPEILESTDGYSSKAADIWSLGVMAYTMLCGRYPFHDQDPITLFNKIKHGVFLIPEPISASSRCLIHSLLRKTPTERLTADELLDHPWFSTCFDLSSLTRHDKKIYDQLVPDVSHVKYLD